MASQTKLDPKMMAVLSALTKLVESCPAVNEKPTQVVRRIASEMKGRPRREVIEACVAAGVKPTTAKTQYQKWHSAHPQ